MINPHEITNFNRTKDELEEFLLFAVMVAGKRADQQAVKLELFLNDVKDASGTHSLSPLDQLRRIYVRDDSELFRLLQKHRLGQYTRIFNCLVDLMTHVQDVERVPLELLESCRGIGGKTARFFLLHSRKDVRHAVLDTHILKFMKDDLKIERVPKSTPSSAKEYKRLEEAFLGYCDQQSKTIAEIDLEIWTSRTKSGTST